MDRAARFKQMSIRTSKTFGFLVESVPILAGFYGLIFLSNVADWYCLHSMFWSLYPSCLELSLVSGVLAAFVVSLGSGRTGSTLTVFSGISILSMMTLGLPGLAALFSYLPNALGVIGGAVVIVAAKRLYAAKRTVPAGLLVLAAVLLSAIVAWRELPSLSNDTAWLQWLGLLICAFVYGLIARRILVAGPASLRT